MPELTVPPSEIFYSSGFPLNSWLRAIPAPGASSLDPPVPPVDGVADCHNLIRNSPPTLLEVYELFAYSIVWGTYLQAVPSGIPPMFEVELAFLINDEVRTSAVAGPVAGVSGGLNVQLASGAWTGDLINPIRIGARDRLSLRLGVKCDTDGFLAALVGVEIINGDTNSEPSPGANGDSSISYTTLEVPARRRL